MDKIYAFKMEKSLARDFKRACAERGEDHSRAIEKLMVYYLYKVGTMKNFRSQKLIERVCNDTVLLLEELEKENFEEDIWKEEVRLLRCEAECEHMEISHNDLDGYKGEGYLIILMIECLESLLMSKDKGEMPTMGLTEGLIEKLEEEYSLDEDMAAKLKALYSEAIQLDKELEEEMMRMEASEFEEDSEWDEIDFGKFFF